MENVTSGVFATWTEKFLRHPDKTFFTSHWSPTLAACDKDDNLWLGESMEEKALKDFLAKTTIKFRGAYCDEATYLNLCNMHGKTSENHDSWQGDGSLDALLCLTLTNAKTPRKDYKPRAEIKAALQNVEGILLTGEGFHFLKVGERESAYLEALEEFIAPLHGRTSILLATQPPIHSSIQSAAEELGFSFLKGSRYFRF